MDKLSPCRRCGYDFIAISFDVARTNKKGQKLWPCNFKVVCPKCGYESKRFDTREEAITSWNGG